MAPLRPLHILFALALPVCSIACNGKPNCKTACAQLVSLAEADIERSLSQMPPETAERLRPKLLALAQKSRASDLATCAAKCERAGLDVACVTDAKTLTSANACLGDKGINSKLEHQRARPDSWEDAPRRSERATLGGTVGFSIDLPRELSKEQHEDGDGVSWEVEGSPWSNPGFHVRLIDRPFPKSAADAVKLIAPPSGSTIIRKEKRGDVFVVVYKNRKGTYVLSNVAFATSAGPNGAKTDTVLCWGTQSSANKTLDLEKTGRWFTDVCSSLKLDTAVASSKAGPPTQKPSRKPPFVPQSVRLFDDAGLNVSIDVPKGLEISNPENGLFLWTGRRANDFKFEVYAERSRELPKSLAEAVEYLDEDVYANSITEKGKEGERYVVTSLRGQTVRFDMLFELRWDNKPIVVHCWGQRAVGSRKERKGAAVRLSKVCSSIKVLKKDAKSSPRP